MLRRGRATIRSPSPQGYLNYIMKVWVGEINGASSSSYEPTIRSARYSLLVRILAMGVDKKLCFLHVEGSCLRINILLVGTYAYDIG